VEWQIGQVVGRASAPLDQAVGGFGPVKAVLTFQTTHQQ
ncbi:uncharacterized protein METZ01_LOCUS308105, partial [marine metagenome]